MIRKIPEETATFHFHNENPKGKRTSDCVIRAIARATGQSWEEVLTGLYQVALQLKTAPADKECYERYLGQQGWLKHPQPRKDDGKKYTISEWCWKHKHKTMVISVANHLTCVIDGQCNDIWDCTDMSVLNYWTHP